MKKLFSTEDLPPGLRFRRWCELVTERIVPVELKPFGERPFGGTLDCADLGTLPMTRVTQTAMQTTSTPATVRRHNKHDTVTVMVVLHGIVATMQRDRAAIQRAGELVVLERQPSLLRTQAPSKVLVIEVPRIRLEAELGSVNKFSSLTIGDGQETARLAARFFSDVSDAYERVCQETAPRLASIGTDLIIASIAERLARDAPRQARLTCVAERAKACIREEACDPTLDPARVAASVGVSLRGLQVLSSQEGWHVSDYIWHQRLQAAGRCLASVTHIHTPIGVIAYQCGFTTQSHFARRFKKHYGLSPSEYRERSKLSRSQG